MLSTYIRFFRLYFNPLITCPFCAFAVKWCYTIGGLGYGWNFTTLDFASRIVCFDTCVVETKLTIHGITERASDSEEQNCSIKTKRASVDPNKIQPYSKGTMCCFFFMSMSVLVLLIGKNKASLGHWFGSTKTCVFQLGRCSSTWILNWGCVSRGNM